MSETHSMCEKPSHRNNSGVSVLQLGTSSAACYPVGMVPWGRSWLEQRDQGCSTLLSDVSLPNVNSNLTTLDGEFQK